MKWGLFGGSFDPVHYGHLRCAEEIIESESLDRMILIPALQQPLKSGVETTPFSHRREMIRRAIEGNPSFSCSDLEGRRQGSSYSIDTVSGFRETAPPGTELYFILGRDAFADIRKWRDWQELLTLCHFVVMTRPGYDRSDLSKILPRDCPLQFVYDASADGFRGPTGYLILFRTVTQLDISSTDIRSRVRAGRSIRYLVPEPVREYINEQKLYRET